MLIAYPALRGKGVQYRGIRKAPHMARFLRTALRPLSRVEASSDVLSLMASHDVSLLNLRNCHDSILINVYLTGSGCRMCGLA